MARSKPLAAPQDVAAYIEEVLGELAQMASAQGLRPLSTSLLMVALEAARLADGGIDKG